MAEQSRSSRLRSSNGWEVDWSKRRRVGSAEQVWARNPQSFQTRARDWHWATYAALVKIGIPWEPRVEREGRHTNPSGYVVLGYRLMTPEDIEVATRNDLWQGGRSNGRPRKSVLEHRLVAAKKYGSLPRGLVVRHRNGDKADNRPENLLLGSHLDNKLDHRTAIVRMMAWRERALLAEGTNLVEALTLGL